MNATKRKALRAIITKLEELDSLRQEIQEELEAVKDEEEESLNNMPESLQESEQGQTMQEYVDTMYGVIDELDCIDLESLADQLRDICG